MSTSDRAWSELGRNLAEKKEFAWLRFFTDSLPLNEILKKRLAEWNASAASEPPFDDRDPGALLSSAGDALDRCLSLRREFQSLSAEAIRRGLEYELFFNLLQTQSDLELASWQIKLAELRSKGHETTAKSFDKIKKTEPLAVGFAASEVASAAALDEFIKSEEKPASGRLALVKQRWERIAAHQQALRNRHQEKGNPLNYEERANRVLSLLLDEFIYAAMKYRAAIGSIERIFNQKWQEAYMTSEEPLDSFVKQMRRSATIFEQMTALDETTIWQWIGGFEFNKDVSVNLGPSKGIEFFRVKKIGVGFRLVASSPLFADRELALLANSGLFSADVKFSQGASRSGVIFDVPLSMAPVRMYWYDGTEFTNSANGAFTANVYLASRHPLLNGKKDEEIRSMANLKVYAAVTRRRFKRSEGWPIP